MKSKMVGPLDLGHLCRRLWFVLVVAALPGAPAAAAGSGAQPEESADFGLGTLYRRLWCVLVAAALPWATGSEEQGETADDKGRQDEEYLEAAMASQKNGTLGDSNSEYTASLGPEDFVALILILLCMVVVTFRHATYRYYRRKFKKDVSADPRKHQSRSAFLRRPPRKPEDLFGADRSPPAPSNSTFQMRYTMRSRTRLYGSFAGTVISRTWHTSLLVGLFAGFVTWWMSLAEDLHAVTGAGWLSAESVYSNAQSCQDIHKMMLPLVTFILAIYVNRRLNWWFGIMTLVWTVQGKLHDLALIVGGGLVGRSPGAAAVKWRIFRYLNLAHFLLYTRLCDRYSGFTEMDLIRSGFLTETEAMVLQKDSGNKKNTVFLWLSHIVQGLIREGALVSEVAINLVDSLKDLRGASSMLTKEMSRLPPFSWAQLLQLMVDALLLMTPPALSYAFRTDHMGWGKYVWPSAGSFVIALFFQGWLELVNIMEDPFGDDLDDLNLDWVLISSECAIFGYLSDPLPLDGLDMASCHGTDSIGVSANDPHATAFSTQRSSHAGEEPPNPLLDGDEPASTLRVRTPLASVTQPQQDHMQQHTVLLSRIVHLLEATATAQAAQGQPFQPFGSESIIQGTGSLSPGRPISPDKSFRMVPSPRVSLSDPNFAVASLAVDGESVAARPAAERPVDQVCSWSPSPMQIAHQHSGSGVVRPEEMVDRSAERTHWSWDRLSDNSNLADNLSRSAPDGRSPANHSVVPAGCSATPESQEHLSATQPVPLRREQKQEKQSNL